MLPAQARRALDLMDKDTHKDMPNPPSADQLIPFAESDEHTPCSKTQNVAEPFPWYQARTSGATIARGPLPPEGTAPTSSSRIRRRERPCRGGLFASVAHKYIDLLAKKPW